MTFSQGAREINMPWSRALTGLVLLTGLVAVVFGCRQEVPPLFRQNRTPETTITVIVEESTTAFYRFHVSWRGEDADGQVVRYLFAITDTLPTEPDDRWDPSLAVDREIGTYTSRTDSVFLFDSGLGTQVFNIVAIDDYGVMDPSPARQYFRVTDNGTPRVVYNSVRGETAGLVPCAPADPCTIPMYTNFKVQFSGTTPNGFIRGVTWSPDLGLFQPFNADVDSVFLDLPKDTLVVGNTTIGTQDSLWLVEGEKVTVFHYSTRTEPIGSGPFDYKVNVLDDARREVIPPAGDRVVTVNYDPDTRLYRVPECNCPNPPPSCDPQNMVPAGWITGINQTDFPMNEWRLFCQGDTLPNLAKVAFYASGWDDPRDVPKDGAAGLRETRYKFRFEYLGPAESPLRIANQNMPLSKPSLLAEDLVLPTGGTFRGARIGWRNCGLDYVLQASAEDEQTRVDGTPAAIAYKVNGSPMIDSLRVPPVFVFVPTCHGVWLQSNACPTQAEVTARFAGTDTIPIFGTWKGDVNDLFALGENVFVFPFKAWAHDHPRDKNPAGKNYYGPSEVGRIRAWRYTFDCTTPLCQDLAIPGEKAWRPETRDNAVDPPNQEVFDENLSVTIPIDTFCVGTPCNFTVAKAYLKSSRFGLYEFTLQGRDSDPFGYRCDSPADLGAGASPLSLDLSEQGRRTQVASRNTVWMQYRDVQATKPHLATPFANRKRLMK